MTAARHTAVLPEAVAGELVGGGWRELGLCRQVDPELFYPVRGASADPAKRVCAGCPVRAECLEEALRAGERHGVWGGTTPAERDHLRPRQPAGRWAA